MHFRTCSCSLELGLWWDLPVPHETGVDSHCLWLSCSQFKHAACNQSVHWTTNTLYGWWFHWPIPIMSIPHPTWGYQMLKYNIFNETLHTLHVTTKWFTRLVTENVQLWVYYPFITVPCCCRGWRRTPLLAETCCRNISLLYWSPLYIALQQFANWCSAVFQIQVSPAYGNQ